MASVSERSDSVCAVSVSGAMGVTVLPMFSSRALIQCASAWTMGG